MYSYCYYYLSHGGNTFFLIAFIVVDRRGKMWNFIDCCYLPTTNERFINVIKHFYCMTYKNHLFFILLPKFLRLECITTRIASKPKPLSHSYSYRITIINQPLVENNINVSLHVTY